jgi:CAAX protease family protein
VLVAVVLALRALELPGALAPGEIRLRSQWQPALAVAALGLLAAPLVHGEAVTRHASIGAVLLAAPIVFVFAGVVEELVFRGAVQGMLEPLLGGWSVPVADLVFGAAYLGSRSPTYAVFMTAFGLACGWWVRRTRSLAGVAVAHGGLAVVLLVLSTS